MALKYQRILLKISGEALGGEKGTGFDEPTMDAICGGVKKAHDLGVQIGIVVGGGNFWRGRSSGKMERTLADKIGMLATVMNALAVSDKLEQLGVETEVFTSITMPQVAPAFTSKDALKAMADGKIAIFGGGTGNPFFSTDTATALRAVEVSADVMFKATMVDGVYDLALVHSAQGILAGKGRCHLRHGDRGEHLGGHTQLLQLIGDSQCVHHRSQHTDLIGQRALHLTAGAAAPEVAAAHNDADLHAQLMSLFHAAANGVHSGLVKAHALFAAQRLAADL